MISMIELLFAFISGVVFMFLAAFFEANSKFWGVVLDLMFVFGLIVSVYITLTWVGLI